MKWMIKYAYWLILTVVLGVMLLLGLMVTEGGDICFWVKTKEGAEKVFVYKTEDNQKHVFLPSFAELGQVTVTFPYSQQILIGGTEIKSGDDCGSFSLNQEYTFQIGEKSGIISFWRSANVPALYIETATGSMEAVYADKDHEEIASISLYSSAGDLEYTDRNCILKGRGNSTWRYEKKPFLLRISDDTSLLGMGEDSDWVLLANNHDESNLHNKLILDMANQVCEEWTPRCEYVDLYLNGQYNGLYLLAEKIESGVTRIDIDLGAGDFLCTLDFSSRWGTLENPFCTDFGRTIAICEPNVLSVEAKDRIVNLVNQQERILMSQEDLTLSQLVDIDSWIRKYLIDEIASNTDADLSSSYFYYSDGRFYAGPVWDYDMVFGNTIQNHYPKAFIAKNYIKYGDHHSIYYNALFGNGSVVKRMAEIYEQEFLPVLTQMIEHDVQDTADQISLAVIMNRVRWPVLPDENPEEDIWSRYVNTPESILHFLREKYELLSDVLISKIPYCTVQFEHPTGVGYWAVSVPYGSLLSDSDVVDEPLYPEVNSMVWCKKGTEEIFDPNKPILADMVLLRRESVGTDNAFHG